MVTETCISSEFYQFILDLYLEKKLDRIILDEAQKIVTDNNYRPKLEDVKQLMLQVQSVYMAGSIPPALLPEFKKMMLVPSIHEIRQPSYKENFRYMVEVYEGEDFKESYVDMIMAAVDHYEEDEKV